MSNWVERNSGIKGEADLRKFGNVVLHLPEVIIGDTLGTNKTTVLKAIDLLEEWNSREGREATYQQLKAKLSGTDFQNAGDHLDQFIGK